MAPVHLKFQPCPRNRIRQGFLTDAGECSGRPGFPNVDLQVSQDPVGPL
jgi:hypothetical protein